ncbi:MAG: phosphoadenosine phosphosulfate reductase [gamma proteobacterium symbiont of Stewartia floridana]|nr:phosphoadenylyl-sulfate reductase [Candidatus Thiodiazotropha taylori]MCG7963516.1 phosphoadenylyl-sulfate reductase [Candidatus Thiodiazotropha endolucinida]RLW55275.1 MAG: phosphoadenosine phosphosulfate reductase [gamma proteobacterium symbiont of Stewartia floridana]MCG7893972.1 phosphoadenylyl-sulfate reductase [Candidatus Thiodiazotropha taylori]MCG7905932.1 phosphoadenylyl-sulfate reductase [Candidatus Thiodiazotropha taylori]
MTHLDSITAPEMVDEKYLQHLNRQLEKRTAESRLEWALNYLPGNHVLTSSFGIQSALMLHMVTEIQADIPVVLVDTGYLFAETYGFIDQLTERLKLNLQIYRPIHSPAWQEHRYGRLWEQGLSGIEHYNRINKVEPLQRALKNLDVGSWFAGLRRQQSSSRSSLPVVRIQDGRFKVHPVIDWHNRDVHRYLRKYDLPYHPLWEQGYASVGDTHTSQPMKLGMQEEESRFFGLKRECGIHE